MSRVRNALKISDVWQPKPSASVEGRVLPLGPGPQAPEEPAAAETHEQLEEVAPVPASLPKAPLSFTARVVRRLKRWLGMRTGVVVPRCNGLTRRGLACRGPAMINGYCRLHGGSRKLLG